jgi:hypothetical protein
MIPALSMPSASPPIAVLVGTGFIASIHVEAFRRLGIVVKGVLGSSPEKSGASATALRMNRGYEGYEEVLARRQDSLRSQAALRGARNVLQPCFT